MELFRCVFIFLVAFLSALKVQSTKKVGIIYEGPCRQGDRYLRADCSATKNSLNSSQCEARANGSSKGIYSTFQILKRKRGSRNIKCIQFTDPSGKKYALKVVNQSRVVFETYQGCSVTRFKEFLFVEEKIQIGQTRFSWYKPFNNPSMCLGKEINCTSLEKLSLLESSNDTDKDKRHCAFKKYS